MANRPSKVIRLDEYTDRDGNRQRKWKDTGILAWHTQDAGKYRLDIGAHITLVPGETYMLVPQEDRDSRGSRDDRGDGRRTRRRDYEHIEDDDIPF